MTPELHFALLHNMSTHVTTTKQNYIMQDNEHTIIIITISNIFPSLTRQSQLKAHKIHNTKLLFKYIFITCQSHNPGSVALRPRLFAYQLPSWLLLGGGVLQVHKSKTVRLAGVEYWVYALMCHLVERFQKGKVVGLTSSVKCAVCLY